MRRDFKGSSIYQSPYDSGDDADPRVGLVNLADVMLVFACGLMIAIVSRWNVNLADVERVNETEMQAVDNVREMVEEMKSGTGGYDDKGRVYEDPETGQLYLLSEVDEDGGSTDGDDADTA